MMDTVHFVGLISYGAQNRTEFHVEKNNSDSIGSILEEVIVNINLIAFDLTSHLLLL